jgi:DNA primase large subunit
MHTASKDLGRQKIDELLAQEDLKDNSTVDELSHFILRISYCQNDELRRWFINHEMDLFQHRVRSLSDKELAVSVKDICQLEPIPDQEKDRLADKLQKFTVNPAEFAVAKFYAVPFEHALDLVSTRQCYLRGGRAYVPQTKLISILAHKFRTNLSRCLTVMGTYSAARLGSDDPEAARIHPLVQNMNSVLVNSEPDGASNALTGATSLDAANVLKFKDNMPLCMRQIQTGLQEDKKLKHWGRLQFGLFLKGAGLSLDDAMAFFQRHFSRITGEEFQKQYAYNIRHMYGKEGKRADYTPYNCSKIILGNAPSAGDHHGCPFAHYDAEYLSSLLTKLQIGTARDRSEIVSLKKSRQFQLACQKHFDVMHPQSTAVEGLSLDNVGNHPNAWFRASVAYHEAKNGASRAADVSPEK